MGKRRDITGRARPERMFIVERRARLWFSLGTKVAEKHQEKQEEQEEQEEKEYL